MLNQQYIYTSKQTRELDKYLIQNINISGVLLMQKAGLATFKEILKYSPKHIYIFCGPGNNGGDGYVIAAYAITHNIDVTVISTCEISNLKGDAKIMADHALALGVLVQKLDLNNLPNLENSDLIIDALLGTGISNVVRSPIDSLIEHINQNSVPVISVDIPSGINADNGCVCGCAIKANITVTYIGQKLGLLTGEGVNYTGKLIFNNLNSPDKCYINNAYTAKLLNLDNILTSFPNYQANSNKTDRGHLFVIAGDAGMPGAAKMAAMAGLSIGAGRVTLLTHPDHAQFITADIPEIMCHGLSKSDEAVSLIKNASCIAVGPGMLAKNLWSKIMCEAIFKHANCPIVIDAGALDVLKILKPKLKESIITPHEGEAARLLGITSKHVKLDRVHAIHDLITLYANTAILKGKGTLLSYQNELSLCPYGNFLLATGGSGDVLTGLIAGLAAQGLNLINSAEIACCLHGASSEYFAKKIGRYGFSATDILTYIPYILNEKLAP